MLTDRCRCLVGNCSFISSLVFPAFGLQSTLTGCGNIVVCGRQTSVTTLSLKNSGLGAGLVVTKRISTLSFSLIFKFWFASNCIEGFNAILSFCIAVPKTLMACVSISGFTTNEASSANFKRIAPG